MSFMFLLCIAPLHGGFGLDGADVFPEPGILLAPTMPISGKIIKAEKQVGIKITKKKNEIQTGVLIYSLSGDLLKRFPFRAERVRILNSGNLLVLHGQKQKQLLTGNHLYDSERNLPKDYDHKILEYDWNGKVVWEFKSNYRLHHDAVRLSNGNTLVLGMIQVPDELKKKIKIPYVRKGRILTDIVLEVNPQGKEVWKWAFYEHVDLNSCGAVMCDEVFHYLKSGNNEIFDWTHTNTVSELPPNKWYKAGDKRFAPGNILIMVRNWSEALIIDKHTKKIVWRYHGKYKGGLMGGHDARMIPEGYPGAGNILILDNGYGVPAQRRGTRGFLDASLRQGRSLVLEVNPVSKEVEWVYDPPERLFTPTRGAVQRLKNGNTLISEDARGRIIVVSPKKEIIYKLDGMIGVKYHSARAMYYPVSFSSKIAALFR
ncbi:MAG: hypothetical protein D6808_05330 [Candidatus Dadabacteria bacterium]|nr:MAG: hypothetical protein D6808_05330 [Candidatus Dadabacteria bacterium]